MKKGDVIAIVGNTGYPDCSTGKHLHFEIQKNGMWVNTEEYLSNKTMEVWLSDDDHRNMSIGSGSWDWPLEGDIFMSQRYGKTPWSYRYVYSNGIHTGVDINSRSSDIIRAPKDGLLYSSRDVCGNSVINIKYIEHSDGLVSFYLHVK